MGVRYPMISPRPGKDTFPLSLIHILKWVATDMLSWASRSSILWFLGSHSLDTLRWIFQDEVKRVYAVKRKGILEEMGVDTDDIYLTTIEFEHGGIAHMENGWITPNGNTNVNDYKFSVLCTKGMINMDPVSYTHMEDLARCHMYGERYVTRALSGDCFLCEGDSWIQPGEDTGLYFKTHQRITFIFRLVGDELKTVHIHNSVDFSDIQEGELFPVQAGRDAYRKLEEKLADKDRQIELMLSQLPGGMMICRRDEVYAAKWIRDNLCSLMGYVGPEEFSECTKNCCRGFILPRCV